jgi:hypothetical protein
MCSGSIALFKGRFISFFCHNILSTVFNRNAMRLKKPFPMTIIGILTLVAMAAISHAMPFWGARQSSPAETPVQALRPGEFIWEGELEKNGPVVVVVSLPEQMAYVYRNGVRIGVATASTGKKGHGTPTGVFTILNKDKNHHSKKYNNAAMPYSERLTWDGVALHAGGLPGYPSSHGCVHLPSEFARLLFEITHNGTTVVVAGKPSDPRAIVHPAMLTPVSEKSGKVSQKNRLAAMESYKWNPAASPAGPLTMVVSSADRRLIVLRNGVEIGRAKVTIENEKKPLGTHAFTVLAGNSDKTHPAWHSVGLPGHAKESKGSHDEDAIHRIRIPDELTAKLYPMLAPGTTMLVTDAPVLEHTTGKQLTVMGAGLPQS